MYIDNRLDLLSSFSEHVIDIRCFLSPSLALLKSKQLRALTSPKFPLSWCTFCLLFTLNAPETSWDWDIRSLWCKTTLYLAIFANFNVQHVSKTRSWYCHIFCTIFCTPKQFFKRERSAKLIQTRNRPRAVRGVSALCSPLAPAREEGGRSIGKSCRPSIRPTARPRPLRPSDHMEHFLPPSMAPSTLQEERTPHQSRNPDILHSCRVQNYTVLRGMAVALSSSCNHPRAMKIKADWRWRW